MRIALGQINPTVGDLDGNAKIMLRFAAEARRAGADLIVFPELSLCGYPPRDLVEVPAFLERTEQRLERLAAEMEATGAAAIVGFTGRSSASHGHPIGNCAALLAGGRIAFVQQKMLLPTYDVFDEWRHFAPADKQGVCVAGGQRIGLTICEDAWNDKQFWERPRYDRDPVEELVSQGVDLIVNVSSSPYHQGKREFRERMLGSLARRIGLPVVMVNQAGGNDHLVFDGSSVAFDAQGRLAARARSFAEDMVVYDTASNSGEIRERSAGETEAIYDALVLGVRDYLRKCGFSKAVIGLSGGVDSAITAVIAADALGADNVLGVGMPGPYSSEGSVRDARLLAEGLGIRFEIVSINEGYEAVVRSLAPVFEGLAPDATEENIQSRLRGLTVMALSNKFGALVLTTGNKSELAVGYCTLYGDMVGGLAVIADVPKTLVYELARVANRRHGPVIPEDVFTKPPSAELRPDQKDTDSLPPYGVLDPILRLYVEEREDLKAIAEKTGSPLDLVREICRKVDRNEYKRQQAAPGLRVTSKAFGLGRRFPIAQRFEP